jgi:hypothetical protein
MDVTTEACGKSSLRLDSTGRPRALYGYCIPDGEFSQYAEWDGAAWDAGLGPFRAADGSLALDASDNPWISNFMNS